MLQARTTTTAAWMMMMMNRLKSQLESIITCIHCKKGKVVTKAKQTHGTCEVCETVQKPTQTKLTAKLSRRVGRHRARDRESIQLPICDMHAQLKSEFTITWHVHDKSHAI